MTTEIDFLPVAYLEAGVHRKNITLRLVIVGAFAAMLVFALLFQQHIRRRAEAQLADLLPEYERAMADSKQLSELQGRVKTAEKQAELYAYLQHPWPRSRIVSALADLLPEEIELERIDVVREPIAGAVEQNHPAAASQPGAALPKVEPAEHDLSMLRDEWDKSQVVVNIIGITEDPGSLHHYLERLGQVPLFRRVDLNSEERIPGDSASRMRFAVRLIVRPSYGQPKGPRPTENVTEKQSAESKAG